MRVFITGGTGLIGSLLVESLVNCGDLVTVYTRSPMTAGKKLGPGVEFCADLAALSSLDGFDAVVNLAGEPIGPGRWSAARKKLIAESRWGITRRLVTLLRVGARPPAVFVSGSAVGYYGSQGEALLEEDARPREDFLHSVCAEWERLALEAASPATRVCISRTGIVLSSRGGLLGQLLPFFRRGLGEMLGDGGQYFSWVHRRDMVDMLLFLLRTERASGIFNLVAPHPVTNRVFVRELARALHKPCWFRIPRFALALAMGEAATLALDGQRASARKINALGFRFAFPEIREALEDIVAGRA